MSDFTCCENTVKEKKLDDGQYGLWCGICGKKGVGKTKQAAYNALLNSAPVPTAQNSVPAPITIPAGPRYLQDWFTQNLPALRDIAAPFIDAPATGRLINNTMRYLMRADLSKAWGTDQGKQSIMWAVQDALELGAELGKMGDIVDFSGEAVYMPKKTAYENALTAGDNAPFAWIEAEVLYKDDDFETAKKAGEFTISVKHGKGRTLPVGVAVYGYNNDQKRTVGEYYGAERLIEKAKKHSRGFASASSPWQGANRPEMMLKMALKSYFRPYVEKRNARAALHEQETRYREASREEIVVANLDSAIKAADEVIEGKNPEKEPPRDAAPVQAVNEEWPESDPDMPGA